MSTDLKPALESCLNHPRFGVAAAEALRVIDWPTVRSQFVVERTVSANESAKIWEARLKSGQFDNEPHWGIEETIASLYEIKSDVQLGLIEAVGGVIGMYFIEGESMPVGVIVHEYASVSATSTTHSNTEGRTI